jgi:hypothetical protein
MLMPPVGLIADLEREEGWVAPPIGGVMAVLVVEGAAAVELVAVAAAVGAREVQSSETSVGRSWGSSCWFGLESDRK